MYNAARLNDLIDVILKRGIQIDPKGIAHKHNEAVSGAPLSPIKLHLCTPDLRKEGRLTADDMQLIVELWYGYIKSRRIPIPAIGGVPQVGLRLVSLLQRHAREEHGEYWPLVAASKINYPDGRREIGQVLPSEEYPEGSLALFDDLINWGFSHREAVRRYAEARYPVTHSFVAVDYGVGGAGVLAELGASSHSLLSLESILARAEGTAALPQEIIAATRGYLVQSRTKNPAHLPAA